MVNADPSQGRPEFDDEEGDEDAVDHEQMEHQLQAKLERNAVIEKLKEPQSYLREEMLGGWLREGAVDWYAEHDGPSSTPVRILEELRGELDWFSGAIKAAGDLKPPIDAELISEAEKLLEDVKVALTTALNEMFQMWAPDGKIEESQRAECSDLFKAAFALTGYTTCLSDLEPVKAQYRSLALFEHVTCFLREEVLGGWLREGAVDWRYDETVYWRNDENVHECVAADRLLHLADELTRLDNAIQKAGRLVMPVDVNEVTLLRGQLTDRWHVTLANICESWAAGGKINKSLSSDFDDKECSALFDAAMMVSDQLGVNASALLSLQEQGKLRKQLKRAREQAKSHGKALTSKTSEVESLQREKRARQSAEAALPEDEWSPAESYVLTPNDETRVGVVGEQYETPGVMGGTIFGVQKVWSKGKSELSLCLHDPKRGYVTDHEEIGHEAIEKALQPLLTAVRGVVGGVGVDKDAQKNLDSKMQGNLKNQRTIASKITHTQLAKALSTNLARDKALVLSLDAQPGILNMVGAKLASYDNTSGLLSLVDRDAKAHHVHRSSGVDCAWLEAQLSREMQAQFDTFVSSKLNRWIIDAQAREYVLCATGAALFGGDTTSIKSSLLLIGAPDQAKSTLLDTLVSAGGCEKKKKGDFYSHNNADPNALLAKSSKDLLRNAMLAAADGTRLCKFNELEGPKVWDGIKSLANMEAQSVTYKKQSDGSTSVRNFETPYALLSCNAEKRPHMPPNDVKSKVAVVVPEMLGRFVDSDADVDDEATFKKVARLDGSDDAGPMLRAMWLSLQTHIAAHPGEPFDHERHMPDCMREARDDPTTWVSGAASSGSSSDDGHQEARVEALKRLFEHVEPPSEPRLFRHAFYEKIATREPNVWALCGTKEQRAKAVVDPSSQTGSRPADVIVKAWNLALKTAFDGLKFQKTSGSKNPQYPNGFWTDELKTLN